MSIVTRVLLSATLLLTLAASSSVLATRAQGAGQPLPAVTVYKDPNCGCCSLWVQHMERAGFRVTATNTSDMPALRAKLGVPRPVQSCHTAVVGDLIVEGHVPADDVKRMLISGQKVKGLAVPGMPIGSPGMEQGSTKHQYSVLTFDASGRTSVFATH